MYDNFFGFKERPFQLVPNPEYLFLSRSHEEAIAHLNYAISNGEGFVEITGEVGTGKTTLCRTFLENLDKKNEVAYIFNPRLDSIQLLKTINDEFGISSESDNSKILIDNLNAFLIEMKTQGKNALLLIDEAQNLDKDVLEQLRLLSNLETNTSKLLQIILVGQPELRQIMDSYELRQLKQRITLSWYLTPLTRKETKEYIRHRINIASQKTDDKFTESAYRKIYKFSKGIPRLINIACDRSLLTAFGFGQRKVTGTIAAGAIGELGAGGPETSRFPLNINALIISGVLVCLISLALFLVFNNPSSTTLTKQGNDNSTAAIQNTSGNSKHHQEITSGKTDNTKNKNTPKAISNSADYTKNPQNPHYFETFLGNLENRSSRFSALKAAISLWNTTPMLNRSLNNMEQDITFFQLAATQNNLHILTVENEWSLIEKLNLPVVMAFLPPGATSYRYLTITKLSGNTVTLQGGEKNKTVTVNHDEMKSYWSGMAYIPWKNFLNYGGDIPLDAPKESIFTLKMLLREIGFNNVPLDNEYDESAREAVIRIQSKHGIKTDGIVGARTKIAIYNEKEKIKKDLVIPHIQSVVESEQKNKQEPVSIQSGT